MPRGTVARQPVAQVDATKGARSHCDRNDCACTHASALVQETHARLVVFRFRQHRPHDASDVHGRYDLLRARLRTL